MVIVKGSIVFFLLLVKVSLFLLLLHVGRCSLMTRGSRVEGSCLLSTLRRALHHTVTIIATAAVATAVRWKLLLLLVRCL